ncbi:MAG: GNAT family N-acetyltransferase [Candidatus Rokuibacteriota bacterium]|nr:MAG: GNAT family N-acetyltransferase [Candidatus Rokubacteria bacterium]
MLHRLNGRAQPAARATDTATRVVSDLRELVALEESWGAFMGMASSPMQHHDWIRARAETVSGDCELHVVVVGRPPDLRAVAPMVRRLDGHRQLASIELDEPTDVLAADLAGAKRLAEALCESGHPLFLRRVPADSPIVAALHRVYRTAVGVVFCRRQVGCPWVPIDASWTEPEQHLNAGRRSDLRRARRIAREIGPIRVDVLSPSPEELAPLLAKAYAIEAASWKGRTRSALVHDSQRSRFYRRYAMAASRRGILRLAFLYIGGHPVAMQLAVECDRRFWLLKIGYDERFARCSPGTLLMIETLRHAALSSLDSYELLGAVEPWTRMWTDRERPCVSLRAYPSTARGLAAMLTDLAAVGSRALGRRWREFDEGPSSRRDQGVLGTPR